MTWKLATLRNIDVREDDGEVRIPQSADLRHWEHFKGDRPNLRGRVCPWDGKVPIESDEVDLLLGMLLKPSKQKK